MTAPVVVGVDGSEPAQAAITLGVQQALRQHRPLRLVHAFEWPLLGVPTGPSPGGPEQAGLRADAEAILAEATRYAAAVADGAPLTITGEVVTGAAAAVLLREAAEAALLVIGDRGLGGFTGLLVGSVAVQLAAHSPAPVLVARGTLREHGPVVVGVDGSASAQFAIEFALSQAAALDTRVLALCAWSARLSRQSKDELPLIYDADDIEASQARLLADALAPARERWPQVPVQSVVRHGRPAQLLVKESTDAQLVVVGARGRGGFAGLLLGSVSQALLYHSHCPVAVVRHEPPE